MLVPSYVLKLINDNDEVVKIIKKGIPFTDELIEEFLLEYRDIATYCELDERYRLHCDTLRAK